ncbi:DUF937 domain-containing protein [Epilithonimonas mollis]|uniref:DUF937 domain-containing protein n=1 Tax=Epilithonimonas mollis TaxID=216903 RepID=A0A1M6PM21_9FLAO|nr:DUF937 domain-containing protein [Epilithonimonas mollis]SHK09004.1 hypothetical protein SAMN05444371_1181 [Epilithonimonas mollis]
MSLLDLITGTAGNQVAEQAENKFGISKKQIIALLIVAAPLVISYLKKKTENAEEADKLNATLDKHHDGSILTNPSQALERESEGNSILDHIFGGNKANVENQLSQNTGISMDKIGPVLATLAPVIMGYIGQQKQANNVNSGGGLGGLLGGILGGSAQEAQASDNPLSDILGSVISGATQSSGGGLGNILGSVLGGENDQKQSQQGGLGGLLGSIFGK